MTMGAIGVLPACGTSPDRPGTDDATTDPPADTADVPEEPSDVEADTPQPPDVEADTPEPSDVEPDTAPDTVEPDACADDACEPAPECRDESDGVCPEGCTPDNDYDCCVAGNDDWTFCEYRPEFGCGCMVEGPIPPPSVGRP